MSNFITVRAIMPHRKKDLACRGAIHRALRNRIKDRQGAMNGAPTNWRLIHMVKYTPLDQNND